MGELISSPAERLHGESIDSSETETAVAGLVGLGLNAVQFGMISGGCIGSRIG